MVSTLLSLFLLIPIAQVVSQAQTADLPPELNADVGNYRLSANGLADAVAETAKHFRFPVGIEWVKDKESLQNLNDAWQGQTVEAILGSIVERYPHYALRADHGLVHVFRHDLIEDNQNFLNLKVPPFFEVRQQVGGLANQKLQDIVQNIVSPRNLPPGAGVSGSYATGLDEKPLTLTLRDLTVREALDKLVEASEHKIWIVTFTDGSTLTPTGFRRTETLWHPTAFADSQQPMWDFLAWEQYPLPLASGPPGPGH